MYCPRCGDTNHDSDRFCSSCGQDLATYRQLWSGGISPSAPAAPQYPVTPTITAPTPVVSAPLPAGLAVPTPAAAPVRVAETPEMPTYLGWASVLLALCWLAFWAAIPALVYAGRTESRLARGDIRGAWDSSRKAKTWCWVTFCAGCVLWAVVLVLVATL
jgi:hypothetical protein